MTQLIKDILERTRTRLGLSEEHLKSPVAALAKALECLEWNEGELVATSQC